MGSRMLIGGKLILGGTLILSKVIYWLVFFVYDMSINILFNSAAPRCISNVPLETFYRGFHYL